jgi:hypothetical protein
VPVYPFAGLNPVPLIIPRFVPTSPEEVPLFVTAPAPAKVSKVSSIPKSSV